MTSFLIFEKNKLQTILMKYALFFIFEKKTGKILNCRLLHIVGWALWVNKFFSGIPLVIVWIKVVTVSLDLDLN